MCSLAPVKRASDEAIYESILQGYTKAREQRAKLRKWQADEVAAFAEYFKEKLPRDYVEFLRQEREFNEIESMLAWDVRPLMREWIPGMDSGDRSELFKKFRDYARTR